VDAVRGRTAGERVLVLVRPETVELGPVENGAALSGEVISQTFLGPVTRLKLAVGEGEMTADVSASRAESFPVGTRVAVGFPSGGARLLSL
jgi:putative spermidine/putrescine transport system ATP-binding protein